MEEETKKQIKSHIIIFLAVFSFSLLFLSLLYFSQFGLEGISSLITAFAVVGGGIKTVNLGWLTNYLTLTIIGGIILSIAVFFIASHLSKKKRTARVEGLMISLLNQAENAISNNNLQNVTQTYQQLQYLYTKLPKKNKQNIHKKIVTLHGKIMMLHQRTQKHTMHPQNPSQPTQKN